MIPSSVWQRLLVYAGGFLSVITLSSAMSASSFGRYSLFQSLIEFSTVLCTLGCTALFARDSVRSKKSVPNIELIRTVMQGFPGALINFLVFFYFFKLDSGNWWWLVTLATVQIILLSYIQLVVSSDKGFDQGFKLNIESFFRSVVVFVLVLGCYFYLGQVSVEAAIGFGVVSNVLVLIWIVLTRNFAGGYVDHVYTVKHKISMLLYSVPSFFVKKFDVIAIGIIAPLEYVGSFKVAFLLAEVPLQFVQSYLNTRAVQLSSGVESFEVFLPEIKNIFILAFLGFIGVGVFCYFYDLILSRSVQTCFYVLVLYFFVRVYSLILETILVLSDNLLDIKFPVLAISVVKYCTILSIGSISLSYLFFAYALSACFDFLLFEFAFFRAYKRSAFFSLVGLRKIHG